MKYLDFAVAKISVQFCEFRVVSAIFYVFIYFFISMCYLIYILYIMIYYSVQRELLDPNNPMVTQLQHRWRDVWRMSVDRKKRLHDHLEHLLEVKDIVL